MERPSKQSHSDALHGLPAWVDGIMDAIARRTLVWQMVNGLREPRVQPEDQAVIRALRVLGACIRALRSITEATDLSHAKAAAAQALEAAEGDEQSGPEPERK